ncbi:MAG: hypothetical protein ACHQ1H_08940 [Nitrososphaerales archaeon]
MKAIIRTNLIKQVTTDSGSLGTLSTIAHKFSEKGGYHGEILHGKQVVGRFEIEVSPTNPSITEAHKKHVTKAEIDLSQLHAPSGTKSGVASFQIEEGGYAVFRVPADSNGGYSIEVFKVGESDKGAVVFDSRKLTNDDYLSIIVLRPGVYSVANALTGEHRRAELTVAYPEKALRALEPVRVRCTKDGFVPEKIRLDPMQGLVFSFEAPSRIVTELLTPDDRQTKRPLFSRPKKISGEGRKKIARRFASLHIPG